MQPQIWVVRIVLTETNGQRLYHVAANTRAKAISLAMAVARAENGTVAMRTKSAESAGQVMLQAVN